MSYLEKVEKERTMTRYGERHECQEHARFDAIEDELDARSDGFVRTFFRGSAFSFIKQDTQDGRWYAHNTEYATLIAYCPWRGVRLPERNAD